MSLAKVAAGAGPYVSEHMDDRSGPSLVFEAARLGAPLQIAQTLVDDRDASGLWVWVSATQLANWLCSDAGTALVQETATAIDLGCGPGLASLCLARLGRRVVATDTDEDALALCKTNADKNGLTKRVHVQRVVWGDRELAARAYEATGEAVPGRLLILGSDLLYDVGEFEALEQTILELARAHRTRGGGVDVLLAWAARGRGEGKFLRDVQRELGAGTYSEVWSGSVSTRGLVGETGAHMNVVIGLLSVPVDG